MKPTWCSLLLVLSAGAPSGALTLSVLPAQPVEDAPFVLAVGVDAACPTPTSIVVTPGPRTVQVTLSDACLTPPQPRLVEIPVGPLQAGSWLLVARLGTAQQQLPVEVKRLPYRIDLVPSPPQAGSPFTVRFTGNGNCAQFFSLRREGNLLTLLFDDNCAVLPPPPAPFVVEQSIEPLPAADYVLQVLNFEGRTLASQRFRSAGASDCVPSATALCLQQGRFRVEATWRTPNAEGVATARPETADSGAFWFFGADNLELLVKVLDACQSPTPKVWVFAAGLTNVEVDLTVTNTRTQAVRRYHNRFGVPFAPVLDVAAFDCPSPFPGG